jgi:hypothetical protein
MRDVVQSLHGLLSLSERGVFAFQDVPVVACLHPWLKTQDDAALIDNPSWDSHGYRWGMSGTYDGKTPHYAVPGHVLCRTGAASGLHITGAQVFDAILNPARSVSALNVHRNTRHWASEITSSWVDGSAAIDVIEQVFPFVDLAWEQSTTPDDFMSMARALTQIRHPDVGYLVHRHGWSVVGFQIVWMTDSYWPVYLAKLPRRLSGNGSGAFGSCRPPKQARQHRRRLPDAGFDGLQAVASARFTATLLQRARSR